MQNCIRLAAGNRNASIIKEMIDAVDKEKMRIMMSVAASHLSKTQVMVEEDVVESYLEKWADAKYDQFLIFGHKLKIEEEIETKMTPEQMTSEVKKLCKQYPQYAILLMSFVPEDYINNSFSGFKVNAKNEDERFVRSIYEQNYITKGKKLSSILSEIVQDKGTKSKKKLGGGRVVESLHSFDIELSKVMQTKMVKGTVCVSIDPLDFLMMSTNKHGWTSCMSIAPETTGYNDVVLSKMTDESTMIAFKRGDDVYQYEFKGLKFDYYSMQVRYDFFLDKMTGSVGSDRGYGGTSLNNKELKKATINLLLGAIAKYCGVENEWVSKTGSCGYATDHLSYNDGVVEAYGHKGTMEKIKRQIYFDIGVKEIVCPRCGKIMKEKHNFICCN